ncbi:hypothetical protein B0H66DRAFT_227070 [Apodospora peruviana]|uniref:Uncharacterized protein n=1 Tax=Apodospora peruviana TaxID=516989 RepID=A0AAE0I4A7_9PEZI|nr:hypothetical protein B0H66DRAFT_227070 [Apodospora peruviana]
MYFTLPSPLYLMLGLLVSSSNIRSCLAAPADADLASITIIDPRPTQTLPKSCSLVAFPPPCYTHTTTTSKCPTKPDCSTVSTPHACPLVIKVTTISVPCSTDCCPTTPTKYVTAPCPGCLTSCVIPTITSTVTTGCKATPTISKI